MIAVFQLLTILEKVVEPELMRICRIRLLNCWMPGNSQSTERFLGKEDSTFIRNAEECLSCTFFRLLVCQVPYTVFERELFSTHGTDLWQDTNFETTHGEQQLRVVSRIDAHESVVPLNGCQRPWQALLDIPEDRTTQIDIVLDQPHTTIPRPATLVIVPDDVVVCGIGIGTEVPLDEISRFFCGESEEDM